MWPIRRFAENLRILKENMLLDLEMCIVYANDFAHLKFNKSEGMLYIFKIFRHDRRLQCQLILCLS